VVEEMAEYANIPIINGLTDSEHPCQALADLQTVRERLGRLEGVRFAYVGDGNNLANSWIDAAILLKFDLNVACPRGFAPSVRFAAQAQQRARPLAICRLVGSPRRADADLDASRLALLGEPTKMNGSKGGALGRDPRGRAPWWGSG
jgi:ornithine carbamoyltransferase